MIKTILNNPWRGAWPAPCARFQVAASVWWPQIALKIRIAGLVAAKFGKRKAQENRRTFTDFFMNRYG